MSLRRITLAALAAAAAAFLVRALATFMPQAFGRPAAALAGLGLLALAALAVAIFFTAVERHDRAPEHGGLRMAAAGAALGWFAVFALYVIRAFAIVAPGLAVPVPSPVLAAVVPFAATVLAVVFLALLVSAARGGVLERPAMAGLLGTLALALVEAVVLVRLVWTGAAGLLPEPTRDLAIAVAPLGAGAFAAVLYFFWAFAREAATPGPARLPGRSR